MVKPDQHPLQRGLDHFDNRPTNDQLLRRLTVMCFRATEREKRDPNYAIPEWVETFGELSARLQSGYCPPKLWRQAQRYRRWGWFTIWFWIPVERVRMRREMRRLGPGFKVLEKGIRWPRLWRS